MNTRIPVSSWGRLSAEEHLWVGLSDRAAIATTLAAQGPGIAFGMGRSYGDVCLNPGGVLWNTAGLDRYIAFDRSNGLLECEAGVLLRDIQRLAIPDGWILPVTPGTQMITVGGALANDIHGKNHHRLGCFGDHVRRIRLLRTDGEVIECGPDLNAGWFRATVGGLGLTGVIVSVTIQLREVAGPWIESDTQPYSSIDEFFALADASEADWEHTVAWIDCMTGVGGRGIFMRGNASAGNGVTRKLPGTRPLAVPFVPPVSLVNRLSLQLFNSAYFNLKKWQAGRSVVHYEPFFYPLDNLHDWNRIYGPRGFYQYQSVIPRATGADAVKAMLAEVARSGDGSFLGVLKTFGDRPSVGMLSFAQPGVTLALDFPNRGPRTLQLFERLDAVVREAGGRLYPAKDARMSRELFERGYPQLSEFLKYRDPGISSGLSRRLMGN